jgi:hypothetical protein
LTTPDKGLVLAQFVACNSYPSIHSIYQLTQHNLFYHTTTVYLI